MFPYIFATVAVLIAIGTGYQTFIAPKRWMKQYGDGIYSPLRKAYKKAAK